MWNVDTAVIVPIVVTANGLIAKSLDEHLMRLSLGGWIKGLIQKAVLLDTARIVKYDSYKTVESIPLSTNAGLIIKDSRFSLRFDDATATYTLSIKDIQENDAGWYQCQVLMSVSNKITAEVELQVRRPPIISDNSTRSIVANEGESVQMECYAGGFPPPKISWRRENNAILPTGGSIYRGNILKIATVHKEDRGTYYCVAENGVGKGARRNINLEVEFAPVVTVPRPRLAQALQYDMDLECHVEAYPPPAITWLKDEIQLSNNQHYRISHFATADEFTDTTIRVITIEKRQYGLFKCKAQNKLGTDEGQVELVESPMPDINYPGLRPDPLVSGSAINTKTLHILYLFSISVYFTDLIYDP
ncbi:hypothetical protein B5X24_HaOG212440 [Helicoverpa armigera]|uniref:Ig-like domain-containing protein n=1 Tax=Helicoverpa armigera TaxID=29058 RepID=A0A2W1B7C4_HELAM|nr:hypothetical protein B5X24_HaOG212440 [Helicoverpa armigera]